MQNFRILQNSLQRYNFFLIWTKKKCFFAKSIAIFSLSSPYLLVENYKTKVCHTKTIRKKHNT